MPDEPAEHGVAIDKALRVVERGRVTACVGLLATFYFENGGSATVRERVVRTLEHFLSRLDPDAVRWSMDPVTREPQRVTGTQVAAPRHLLGQTPPGEAFEVIMHGGQTSDDADPYRIVAAASARPTAFSYVSVGVPFAWVTANDPGMFTRLVVELADRLEPSHGYAGLGALGNVDIGPNDPDLASILPLVLRFSGLELDLPTSHSIYLKQEDAIKGINWLTVLEDRWVKRLGGETALKQTLGPGVEWHPFRSGVVIQAGPRPQFGDRNRTEPMTYYRQVAQALKPLRVSSIRGVGSAYGFDRARADEWLARFD